MRYWTLYVETQRRWAVVDTLSGTTGLKLFETEDDARAAALMEERRWAEALADAGPAPA